MITVSRRRRLASFGNTQSVELMQKAPLFMGCIPETNYIVAWGSVDQGSTLPSPVSSKPEHVNDWLQNLMLKRCKHMYTSQGPLMLR